MAEPGLTIPYHIPHDENGGSLQVFGSSEAPHLVIMFAGYPDDHSAFQPLASKIASSCNCLVGVGCLPGFDNDSKNAWKDGYTFEDWVACVREAVKALRSHAKDKNAKLTGIFHDWGCGAGAMYTNSVLEENAPALIPDQLVLFDVLLDLHPKTENKPQPGKVTLTKLYSGFAFVSYQLVFATAFALHRYISKYVAMAFICIFGILLELLRLSPASPGERSYLWPKALENPYKAYPYFVFWKTMLFGSPEKDLRGAYLPLDLKRTPVLFLYGVDKKFQFHSEEVTAFLEGEKEKGGRSRVVAVGNASHWLYLQQPDVCYQEVKSYLEALK